MIKKYAAIVAIVATLFSCSNEIEFNSPSIQASKDGELFRASERKAVINPDGSLTITGTYGSETIQITTSSLEIGAYRLAEQSGDKASFMDQEKNLFSAKTNSTENGEIIIQDISNNEITGTFRFNLYNNGDEAINFQEGWFYKIPLENAKEIGLCDLNLFTASVDGSGFASARQTIQDLGDTLLIVATAEQEEEITLFLPQDVDTGSYSLTGSGDYSATYEVNNDRSSAVNGILNVTTHDKETRCITGDFEFTTTTGATVNNGYFELGY